MAFVPRDEKHQKLSDNHFRKLPAIEPHVQTQKIPKHASVTDDNLELTQPSKESARVPKNSELIETVFEKLAIDSVTDSLIDIEKEPIQTPPLHFDLKEPQSTPLSKNKLNDNLNNHKSASNVNSVNSSPTPRLFRRRTNTSSVFPIGCMGCKDEENANVPSTKEERGAKNMGGPETESVISSSSKEVERNSLTGTETQQATRRRLIKRKDGNPLLGIGYDDPNEVDSNSKVPPGGFSHDLW